MPYWGLQMQKSKSEIYSVSRLLKNESRSNSEFEKMLSNLSLEEVIALKLEISSRELKGKLYSFPLWKAVPHIAKDAVVKFSLSITKSKGDAARLLGVSPENFYKLCKKYDTDEYFLKLSQKST